MFAPRLSFVGVHLFSHWLEQPGSGTEVLEPLEAAIAAYRQTHPEEDFPLLHHRRETLQRRFQALFFAPLFGLHALTECDRREPPLATLIGRGYPSTTLNQFLAQLERYVDGHMIAYWNRGAMHKGKITM